MKYYFKLKDIIYKITNTLLYANKLNNELKLFPEVVADVEDENVEYEMRSVCLYHNNGFNTHISTFEELKGKKFTWNSQYNKDNEEAGYFHVQEHENVTKGSIEIIKVDNIEIIVKWRGLANVFWNEKYGKNVPFETVFAVAVPQNIYHIIDAFKSSKILINDNTYLELLNLKDFNKKIKKDRFYTVLKFKLTHENTDYFGEIIFTDRENKNNYQTVFDKKCPLNVKFKGFDYNLEDEYEIFRFEVLFKKE